MSITRQASRLTYPGLLLACFSALALSYGLVIPPFENLDEIEHFEAIRYVAQQGKLPVHDTSTAELYHYRQEASQPPLYYLLSAGLVRLLGLQADDATAATPWRPNPWVACGPGGAHLYDNRTTLYHNPHQEAFPWRGTLLMLHTLRAWSTLLQMITVAAAYLLGRTIFPDRPAVGIVGMAIVAFNPQFLLVASGVNNDNLVTPLVALGLCLLVWIWRDGLTTRRALLLGLLTGLAGLSKLSGWGLLGIAAIVTGAQAVRARKDAPRILLTALTIPVVALTLGGWWFWRNWRLYGDPTALQPMLEWVGMRGGTVWESFGEASAMFRSFWGQIPCAFYPPGLYAFYGLLTALAAVGLAWHWRRWETPKRQMLLILGGWFLIVTLSWARWNALTPAPGGRLLFPALPAVAVLIAAGMDRLTHRFRWMAALVILLLAAMAVWTRVGILPRFFAPPPRHEAAADVHPQRPLDAAVTLGDAIQLLGSDITLNGDESETTLDITLYWHTLAPLVEDYALTLQFVSPVPGDDTLRWNYNSWPGRGTYPTSAWQTGEVIADRYRFRLPEADLPTQAWNLHLALYREETGERLPVHVDGADSGHHVVLSRLRLPGRTPTCPPDGRLASDVIFGDMAQLTHAEVSPHADGLTVTLCWQALQSLPADYTVFVHLLDADGALVATGDGPPMGGAFPTSLWQPGDVVRDVHEIPTTELDRAHTIAVGLYRPEDDTRLTAIVAGQPRPDGAVPVWPDLP